MPIISFALVLIALTLPGCVTRTVQQTVVDDYGITIKLRSQAKPFGEATPRGFEQPAVIPAPRLALILGGIEIDQSENESNQDSARERRPAIPSKLLKKVSRGLSKALSEASPDQEVVVLAVRKQRQHGLFHRKFLTSFVSYLKQDQIYFFLSRVEWPMDNKRGRRPTARTPPQRPSHAHCYRGKRHVYESWCTGCSCRLAQLKV